MSESNNWLDDLLEEVSDLLSDHKIVKFNTKANRKNFIKRLQNLISESVEENTTNKENGPTITRPNPNKTQGFAVMTEGLSSAGDDVLKNKSSDPYKEKIQDKKRGVRTW